MARPSEISSTQKLLGVIRKKRHGAPAVTDSTETPLKKTGRYKLSSPSVIALHKTSTVGIDIGRDYLRLVRVTQKGRGNWQILDRRRLAVPPDTPVDTPEFAAFLKSALASVCGSPKHSRLWVLMSSARVEMNPITIPKVPKKQLGNVVYWTVKKEAPFDEKEMILDFEVQGEVIEQGIPKAGRHGLHRPPPGDRGPQEPLFRHRLAPHRDHHRLFFIAESLQDRMDSRFRQDRRQPLSSKTISPASISIPREPCHDPRHQGRTEQHGRCPGGAIQRDEAGSGMRRL